MHYTSLFALSLLSHTALAIPTPQFSTASTSRNGPPSGLLPCGSAFYTLGEYVCYGDVLCPVLSGAATSECGGACYQQSLYRCDQGVLVSFEETKLRTGGEENEMSSENMVDGSEPDGNDDGVAKKEETASTNKLDGSEPDTADDGVAKRVAKRESGDNGDDAPSGTVEKREPR
ncbi:MAG: hypothetical protein Q9221_009177, partial [Calogaya cf. arnoldii]